MVKIKLIMSMTDTRQWWWIRIQTSATETRNLSEGRSSVKIFKQSSNAIMQKIPWLKHLQLHKDRGFINNYLNKNLEMH